MTVESVINCDLMDMHEELGKFDFIYAIQVFEHLRDPEKFLSVVRDHLAEGGRFLLEIPNVDDPLLSLYKNKTFSDFYWYPYHCYFYDVNTLEVLLKKVPLLSYKMELFQRYGMINHMRWNLLKRPGNFAPTIPLIDSIYKWILTCLFKKSDTIILEGRFI